LTVPYAQQQRSPPAAVGIDAVERAVAAQVVEGDAVGRHQLQIDIALQLALDEALRDRLVAARAAAAGGALAMTMVVGSINRVPPLPGPTVPRTVSWPWPDQFHFAAAVAGPCASIAEPTRTLKLRSADDADVAALGGAGSENLRARLQFDIAIPGDLHRAAGA